MFGHFTFHWMRVVALSAFDLFEVVSFVDHSNVPPKIFGVSKCFATMITTVAFVAMNVLNTEEIKFHKNYFLGNAKLPEYEF